MFKHPIVHVDIPAGDPAAAAQFYGEIFGWKIQNHPEMNYATFESQERSGGGFAPLSADLPVGAILVHIQTDDIERDLARIADRGGKILMHKTDIPGVGWYGLFQDPTGNKLSLFTPLPDHS